MNAGHCTADVVEKATGQIEAQHLIQGVVDGSLSPMHAWLAFATLAACHGWRSPACMAFVTELAKRATSNAGSD